MKKLYVKPEASCVAFVVNENIATSLVYTENQNGEISYVQYETDCNDILNSTDIETGLKDGCVNINHVIAILKGRPGKVEGTTAYDDLMAIMQGFIDRNEVDKFNCATI